MGAYGLVSRSSRQGPLAVFHGDGNESSLPVNIAEFIDSLRVY
jgi:hypothetical protein